MERERNKKGIQKRRKGRNGEQRRTIPAEEVLRCVSVDFLGLHKVV